MTKSRKRQIWDICKGDKFIVGFFLGRRSFRVNNNYIYTFPPDTNLNQVYIETA